MNVIEYRGRVVAVFNEDSPLEDLEDLQERIVSGGKDFIWVALDGTDSVYLDPMYSIIKNPEASLMNHFMWDGLFTEEERDKRMWEMVDEFIDSGKQYIIENYEFVEDEPFYDYSGGRD